MYALSKICYKNAAPPELKDNSSKCIQFAAAETFL